MSFSGASSSFCPEPPSPLPLSPASSTTVGVLVILFSILGQLELFALLSRRGWVPTVLSRKLTHIGSGVVMTTALALFPPRYWPARLAVSLFLVGFMLSFAALAYLPEDQFERMPPFVRQRIDGLVRSICRSGDRAELMRGTFYYAFAVATFVLLFWTAPINVVIFASLFVGDGVADPIGRILTGWALARSRGGGAAAAAGEGTPSKEEKPKALAPWQYQFFYFGVKSVPGSVAFFVSALGAAAGWAALFHGAGHYPPDFTMPAFLAAAAACVGAATLAEAISPPHVDNLLVTYAAAATAFCLNESGIAPFLMQTCA